MAKISMSKIKKLAQNGPIFRVNDWFSIPKGSQKKKFKIFGAILNFGRDSLKFRLLNYTKFSPPSTIP